MSANSGVLKAPAPVRVPVWIVIGVALVLTGALAVVSISERGTVTRAPAGGAVTEEKVVPAQGEAAGMAALKSAVAQQYWARELGIGEPAGGQADVAEVAALKSAVGQEYMRERAADTTFTFNPPGRDRGTVKGL